MDRWLIVFFIGAILSLFMPIVPEFFYVNLCTTLGLACLLSKKIRILSALFLGIAWILFHGMQYQQVWQNNNLKPKLLFSSAQLLQGTINSIPTKKNIESSKPKNRSASLVSAAPQTKFNYKFNFMVSHINGQLVSSPFLVRLNWNYASGDLNQGEEWFLKTKLKPPHGFTNQGGFNYQVWLRKSQIAATGYVVKYKNNQILGTYITQRQSLYNKALNLLPEREISSLLLALSFGEKSRILQDTWQTLQKTNTQHLIAISGLHLGLIATGSFFLFTFIIRMLPIIKVFKHAPKTHYLLSSNSKLIVIFLSFSLTFYYAYLAGFSLPTIRALMMIFLFWFSRLIGIKLSLFTWFFLTLFLVIIISPFSLITGSFWLSFYAVSLILLTVWRFKAIFIGRNRVTTWLKSLFYIQLSLSVLMLPLSMLFNYQLSLASILANLVAVPVMSFTSIPLCLLAVLVMPFSETLSTYLYKLALISIQYVWRWLEFLSGQSWMLMDVSFNSILIVSSALSLFGLICFLSIKWRAVSLVILLGVIYGVATFFFARQYNEWKVVVIDVGQGLSVLIEKNNHGILYDTGASYPSGFNLVEAAVLPYLKHQGIWALDKVIISHSDNDHAGGLNILRKKIKIHELMASDPKLRGDLKCEQGNDFVWQGLTFSILWPLKNTNMIGDENDHSCVIKVSDGMNSVLLTGDISMKVEKLLVNDKSLSLLLNSDVVIAPHHGSNTSSSLVFIQSVSPKHVTYSTGFMNRWNMPTDRVQKRYKENNVDSYNTATSGMVEVTFELDKQFESPNNSKDKTITIVPYKEKAFPFWFAH